MTTRRELLTLLAAAVAPGLPQVPRLERRGPAQQVLVLGAGLAGLCAAYELQNLGHGVTVLEAQTRPGGRVRTLREPFAPGLYAEAGAESIPGVHDLTQHYARAFGLTLVANSVPGTRGFYHVRGRRVLPGDAAVWPFDLTEEERKLGLSGLSRKYIDAAADQARGAGFAERPVTAMSAWDNMTPGAWLRSLGASPAATELDPWQRGSFALHTPGQIAFIDTLAQPEGRMHFAGEHTSAWTGWMQGALESARRVVGEISA